MRKRGKISAMAVKYDSIMERWVVRSLAYPGVIGIGCSPQEARDAFEDNIPRLNPPQ